MTRPFLGALNVMTIRLIALADTFYMWKNTLDVKKLMSNAMT